MAQRKISVPRNAVEMLFNVADDVCGDCPISRCIRCPNCTTRMCEKCEFSKFLDRLRSIYPVNACSVCGVKWLRKDFVNMFGADVMFEYDQANRRGTMVRERAVIGKTQLQIAERGDLSKRVKLKRFMRCHFFTGLFQHGDSDVTEPLKTVDESEEVVLFDCSRLGCNGAVKKKTSRCGVCDRPHCLLCGCKLRTRSRRSHQCEMKGDDGTNGRLVTEDTRGTFVVRQYANDEMLSTYERNLAQCVINWNTIPSRWTGAYRKRLDSKNEHVLRFASFLSRSTALREIIDNYCRPKLPDEYYELRKKYVKNKFPGGDAEFCARIESLFFEDERRNSLRDIIVGQLVNRGIKILKDLNDKTISESVARKSIHELIETVNRDSFEHENVYGYRTVSIPSFWMITADGVSINIRRVEMTTYSFSIKMSQQ